MVLRVDFGILAEHLHSPNCRHILDVHAPDKRVARYNVLPVQKLGACPHRGERL